MAIKNLTKTFRLIWNEDKSIQVIGEFLPSSVTGTIKTTSAEFDAKEELIAKIQSDGLVFSNEQKQDPDIQKLLPAELLN